MNKNPVGQHFENVVLYDGIREYSLEAILTHPNHKRYYGGALVMFPPSVGVVTNRNVGSCIAS